MMFCDVLCLKSILGFLLLERTSGVSKEHFRLTGTNSLLFGFLWFSKSFILVSSQITWYNIRPTTSLVEPTGAGNEAQLSGKMTQLQWSYLISWLLARPGVTEHILRNQNHLVCTSCHELSWMTPTFKIPSWFLLEMFSLRDWCGGCPRYSVTGDATLK